MFRPRHLLRRCLPMLCWLLGRLVPNEGMSRRYSLLFRTRSLQRGRAGEQSCLTKLVNLAGKQNARPQRLVLQELLENSSCLTFKLDGPGLNRMDPIVFRHQTSTASLRQTPLFTPLYIFQTCICDEGYKGAGCSEPDCPGEPDCYNNGECSNEPYFEDIPDPNNAQLTVRRLITLPRCINCQTGWIGRSCGTRCVDGVAVSGMHFTKPTTNRVD